MASVGEFNSTLATPNLQQAEWVPLLGAAAANHLNEKDVILNPPMKGWQAGSHKVRSSGGAASAVRTAKGPAYKTAAMVMNPVLRRATLATVEHTRRGRDAYASYKGALTSLQSETVHKALVHDSGFRDDLEVRESDRLYEAVCTEDGSFVRLTQLLGSYARRLSIQEHSRRERLATVQSMLVTRQTVFGIEPASTAEFLDGYDLGTSEPQLLEDATVDKLNMFVDAGVDVVVPLTSALHGIQDFRIMNREIY